MGGEEKGGAGLNFPLLFSVFTDPVPSLAKIETVSKYIQRDYILIQLIRNLLSNETFCNKKQGEL